MRVGEKARKERERGEGQRTSSGGERDGKKKKTEKKSVRGQKRQIGYARGRSRKRGGEER